MHVSFAPRFDVFVYAPRFDVFVYAPRFDVYNARRQTYSAEGGYTVQKADLINVYACIHKCTKNVDKWGASVNNIPGLSYNTQIRAMGFAPYNSRLKFARRIIVK